MKISRISKQETRDRYNLYADHGFLGAISANVLADWGLQAGDEVTEAELTEKLGEDHYGKALNKAYDLLSRRPHSRAELERKLTLKEYEADMIAKVLDYLTEQGYLDDADFARRWIALRGGTRGDRKLGDELRQKGVAVEIITATLSEGTSSSNEDAEALARKRLTRMQGEPWEKIYSRIGSYLSGRGYDYTTVRNVMDRLKAEL